MDGSVHIFCTFSYSRHAAAGAQRREVEHKLSLLGKEGL
jgi:hypothetical protein